MKRKILQSHVNTFAQVVSEHWLARYEDLQVLSRRKNGTLVVDVLSAACTIDGDAVEPLRFARDIRDWFCERLRADDTASSQIERAAIEVRFSVEVKTFENKSFPVAVCGFVCRSEIATLERTYLGQSESLQRWGYIDPLAVPGTDPMWEL